MQAPGDELCSGRGCVGTGAVRCTLYVVCQSTAGFVLVVRGTPRAYHSKASHAQVYGEESDTEN